VSDVFLGVIAAAVVVMAAVQVAAVVFAARVARRLDRIVDRLEHEIQPVLLSLQSAAADAARATAAAAAQIDRAAAWLEGLKAILSRFGSAKSPEARPKGVDEDEALFIG
jgi:hypothetical protein